MLRTNESAAYEKTTSEIAASRSAQRDTNMGPALHEATKLLEGSGAGRVKKIILLTDGEATDTNPRAAIDEGEAIARKGWSLDCLGLGKQFNRMFLQEVVAASLGRTQPLDSPSDAERLFDDFLKKTQQIVATNLNLKITFSPRVVVQDWYRGAPENQHLGKVRLSSSREFSVSLGSVERDQSYDYFFLVRIPGITERRPFVIGTAEVTYDLPGEKRASRTAQPQWALRVGSGRRPVVSSDLELDFLLTEIGKLEHL
jgi:hypothetical protein